MNPLQAEHLYSLALAISHNGERLAELLGDVDGPGAALAHTAELLGNQLLELAIAHQAATGPRGLSVFLDSHESDLLERAAAAAQKEPGELAEDVLSHHLRKAADQIKRNLRKAREDGADE